MLISQANTNKKWKFLKRILALLLVPAFLLSNIAFASVDKTAVSNKNSIDKTELSIDKVNIPVGVGSIKAKYQSKSPNVVFHIQDAHCNYEAQKNIAKILEHLIKNYNVNFVAVEGADGLVDTAWFKAFPDTEVRREAADYFMKKGEITGTEFLSITTDYPFTIYGAEDREYYIKNLNAFLESYPHKESFLKYYNDIKSALSKAKRFLYPKDLLDFDSKIELYKDKKTKFADHITYLTNTASAKGVILNDFPNIKILANATALEKKINFDIVNDERSKLIDELSKKMSKDKVAKLVAKSLEFKLGQIDGNEFYAYLNKTAEELGVDMAKSYGNLSRYIVYLGVYSQINNEKLFDEIDQLVASIKEKMFTSDEQRELDRLWTNVNVIIGFMNIALTNKEFEYYLAHKDEFSPAVFADFITKISTRFGLSYVHVEPGPEIMSVFPKLISFYEIAMKRDNVIVDNMFKGMHTKKTDVAVLITGGFHTKGVSKILEAKNVSYVVISPTITKEADSPYLSVLTGQKTPFEALIVNEDKPATSPLAAWLLSDLLIQERDKELLEVRKVEEMKAGWVDTYVTRWLNKSIQELSGMGMDIRNRELVKGVLEVSIRKAIAKINRDRQRPAVDAAEEQNIIRVAEAKLDSLISAPLGTPGSIGQAGKPFITKKAPGTPDLTEDELEWMLGRITDVPNTYDVQVGPEAEDLIKSRAPPIWSTRLLSMLKAGKLKVKAVPLGDDVFFFERKNKKYPGLAALYDFEKGFIYVPEAYWKRANQHQKAQAVLHEYVEQFGGEPEYGTPHGAAVMAEMHIASDEARRNGVSDYTQFFLDVAVETKNLEYLLYLVSIYEPRRDPGRSFLNAIYKGITKLSTEDGFPIKKLETELEVLAWYRFSFDTSNSEYKGIRPYHRARLVSEKIRDMESAGLISTDLRKRCFFVRDYQGRQKVYIPQSLVNMPPDMFLRSGYELKAKTPEAEALLQQITDQEQNVETLIASAERKGEIKRLQSVIASYETLPAYELAWRAAERVSTAQSEGERLEMIAEAKKLFEQAEAAINPESNVPYSQEARDAYTEIEQIQDVKDIKAAYKKLETLKVHYYSLLHEPFLNFMKTQIAAKVEDKKRKGEGGKPLVVAIFGSGGSGKTSLIGPLTEWFAAQYEGGNAKNIGLIPTDRLGMHPETLRYDVVAGNERLSIHLGPEMYSAYKMSDALDRLLNGKSVDVRGTEVGPAKNLIVMEGITPAHFSILRDRIDLTIAVNEENEEYRFDRKLERDMIPVYYGGGRGLSREYLINDFCSKQFHEKRDIIQRDILEMADIVWSYVNDPAQASHVYLRYEPWYWTPKREMGMGLSNSLRDALGSLNEGLRQVTEDGVDVDASSIPIALEMIGGIFDEATQKGNAEIVRRAIKDVIERSAQNYPIFTRGILSQAIELLSPKCKRTVRLIVEDIIDDANKNKKVVTIIPVGGRGEGFGPFSYSALKPFVRLFGKSHVVWAAERAISTGRAAKDIFFIIEREMIPIAQQELAAAGIHIPAENFIPEDKALSAKGKEKALEKAALFGYAAVYISKLRGPDTVIVTERSDYVLLPKPGVMEGLKDALTQAENIAWLEPTVALLGNPPLKEEKDAIGRGDKSPDANKGYIAVDPGIDTLFTGVQSVSRFHEKPMMSDGKTPDTETMKQYIADGASYNASFFVFRADQVLRMFETLRPEDYAQLMRLYNSIGTPEESAVTAEVNKYFVSDSGSDNVKICVAFEEGIVQAVVPPPGKGKPDMRFGVAVSPFNETVARQSVGGQGSLRGVWPDEKVGDNYIRPVGTGGRVQVGPGVKNCNILFADDDTTTQAHVFGVRDVAVAYEHKKHAVVVIPIKASKQAKNITATIRGNDEIKAFAEPEAAALPTKPRTSVESNSVANDNLEFLGNNGFAVTLYSNYCATYSEEGIVSIMGMGNTIVISRIENGTRHIYVYGPDALHEGMLELAKLAPASQSASIRLAEVLGLIRDHKIAPEAIPALMQQVAKVVDRMINEKKLNPAEREAKLAELENLTREGQLTPIVARAYAESAAADFFLTYNNNRGYLTDAISTLLALASHENPEIAAAASEVLLKDVVQTYKDAHNPQAVRVWLALSIQVIQYYRNPNNFTAEGDKQKAAKLDGTLRGFGLNAPEDIAKRYWATAGREAPFNMANKDRIKAVFVLSRGKIGGEIACNSIIMQKAASVFPDAKVILVGGKKSQVEPFYTGLPVVGQEWKSTKTPFDRYAYFHITLDAIEQAKQANGVAEGEYIVIDSASPFFQLGLLPTMNPASEPGNYFFYDMVPDPNKTIGEEISAWMNRIFGPQPNQVGGPYTHVDIAPQHRQNADIVWDRLKLGDKRVVTVAFSTDDDETKWINPTNVDFEVRLVSELIRQGNVVMLSTAGKVDAAGNPVKTKKGNPGDVARAREIMRRVQEAGLKVTAINTSQMDTIGVHTETPDLIGFQGSYGDFGALMGRSAQLICNSSSPKHVAGALGVPIVEMYVRDQGFDQWKPYSRSPVDVLWIDTKDLSTPEAQERAYNMTMAHVMRQKQLVELSRTMVTNNTSQNLVFYAWGGEGLGEPGLAEIWNNSTQPTGDRKLMTAIPDTRIIVGNEGPTQVVLPEITLKELIDSNPGMLGERIAKKPMFVKYLHTRFPPKVVMGFNKKIEEKGGVDKFIAALQLDRRLIVELKANFKTGLTEQEFNNVFKPEYERWVNEQSIQNWHAATGVAIPNIAGIMKPGYDVTGLMEKMRRAREEVTSYLHIIDLKPGQVILSPAGHPHGIFGLSLQTHPPSWNPESKNEAWIIMSTKNAQAQEQIVLIEPQEMSNTTYSFADFNTPLVFKDGAVALRKDMRDKLDAIAPTRPKTEDEAIDIMIRKGLKREGFADTSAFDITDKAYDVTPSYLGSINAEVKAVIEGTYPPVWDRELFVVHLVSLNGEGEQRPALINIQPNKDAYKEIEMISGEVVITGPGITEIRLRAGQKFNESDLTSLLPATAVGEYTIQTIGKAQFLLSWPGDDINKRPPMPGPERLAETTAPDKKGAKGPSVKGPKAEPDQAQPDLPENVKFRDRGKGSTAGGRDMTMTIKPPAPLERDKFVVDEVAQAFGTNLATYTSKPCTIFVQQGLGVESPEVRKYIKMVYGVTNMENLSIKAFTSLENLVGDIPEEAHAIICLKSELNRVQTDQGYRAKVKGIIGASPLLAVNDKEAQRGQTYIYRTEILATAIMAAHTTKEDLDNRNNIAEALLRAIRAMTPGRNLTINDLRDLLAADGEGDESLITRINRLIKELLLEVPIRQVNMDQALNNEREVQWAA